MQRSIIATSAFALSVSLAAFCVTLARPAHAADPLPDARMLAAKPFQFQADSAIFSRLPDVPSDSRIFSPRKSLPRGLDEQFSMHRAENRKQL
jgi:hypothetical protein